MSETKAPPRSARGMMITAFGNSAEEARESIRRQKEALIPSTEVPLPALLTSEQIDVEIDRRVTCILNDVAELKGLLVRGREVLPEAYATSFGRTLYQIWTHTDDLWQSLHDNEELGEEGGTLSGFLMREQRLGRLGSKLQMKLVDLNE